MVGAVTTHFLPTFSGVRQGSSYILIFLLLGPLRLLAQDPYYRVIDASDGLPNNDVYCLFQDTRGFVWITTDDGLCRFDGHAFKSFTSTTQSAKAGANIFEDMYGRIWYENFDGRLYYVSGDTLVGLVQDAAPGFTRGQALGDKLYYPLPENIEIYDLKSLQKIPNDVIPKSEFIGVNTMGERQYWVQGIHEIFGFAASGQVTEIDMSRNKLLKHGGVAFDAGGTIYFMDYHNPDQSIYRLERGVFQPFYKLHGEGGLQQHALSDGKIWVCYARGMEVIDLKTRKQVGERLYFPDKSITAVMTDREGNHWLGTQNQGLIFIPDFFSQSIPSPAGGLSQIINTPMGLVAGTQNGELLRYDPLQRRFELLSTHGSRHAVDYLKLVHDWILEASPIGNFRKMPDVKTDFTAITAIKDAELVSPRYLAITVSGSSGLLELPGADQAGPDPWDSIAHTMRNVNEPAFYSPLSGRGRAVACRPGQDAVYYATANGLMRLTPKGYGEVTWHGRRMYGAKMDADRNNIYLLTTQGDLFLIDPYDNFIPITDLPLSPPYSQLKLLDDKLYLLARRQLMQLDLQGARPVLENMIVGLETSAINDLATYGGQLALATDNGLILLDPDHKATERKPEVVITGLEIAGRSWPTDSLAVVNYEDNEIAIDYAILHFRTLGEFPLYYRINQEAWSKTNPSVRQLLLAQLSPGDYVIEFCLGAPGAEVAARVQVHILRPFWMRIWFYILCFLLVVLMTAIWVWRRAKAIQRKHHANMEKLELENNLRQSTLTAIRSQMNPHFFFNALNTIQAFIFSDDKINATNYLSKFSKLTRMVLEMSEKETVSLEEEIHAITLYLELEKSRFGDDFNFQIEVGTGVSPMRIQLPSMIIQPFVENAVKHGLLHQSGAKELHLTFQVDAESLVIVVDDNGIGRKRSEELQRIRQERHQPFSVIANKKRIDILNEGHKHIGVAFIDKYDPDGRALGTTVTIKLPLIQNPTT